ncbi:MAG TPA: D-alanine--D-alanine ligase family protein [Acidimicrobiales bacterium]|nr:D-alanine--D-alanine ligase family protein [Acidimicrobiales bacterium]
MTERPDRVRLVVLFGGQSAEHEVSCTTAAHVLRAVDPDRYDVVPVGITREGTWVQADDARAALARGAIALPAAALPERLEATGTAVEPLRTVAPAGDDEPVVVLPLLHGPHGEDGTVQGLLELAGVPYVGGGVLASALAMDKVKAKETLSVHGLPQVAWTAIRDTELDGARRVVAAAGLPYPLFVKPANLGSSVGVSKVHDPSGLDAAVALAADYDEWIVIEEGVDAREIEVAVLGNAAPRASLPGEVVPSHEFYDYDDKYVDGTSELLVPAPLAEAHVAEVQALALDAYRALRCEGMARVDFLFEERDRGFLVNEVNTIPGFTPISMYPKLWEASGVSYPDLIDELVRLAVERHERRSRFSTKR